MEKENTFSIVRLLLYDAIPCIDLKDLCKEAACTTRKCLPVHHVFHWSFGEIGQNHYDQIGQSFSEWGLVAMDN